MNVARSEEYLIGLAQELCREHGETEWVEFKHNNANPQEIGEYISALANSAALHDKSHAYLLWGVDNSTHKIIGTTFNPRQARHQKQPLHRWLIQLLSPGIHFEFHAFQVEGCPVVLLEIERAAGQPVRFQGVEYVRLGEAKMKLSDAPAEERVLWRRFDRTSFESGVAAERLDISEVSRLLHHDAYFYLQEWPAPENRQSIAEALAQDHLLKPSPAGGWDISNLGAILFARRLDDFPTLKRKAVRIIQYQGNDRLGDAREQVFQQGYAAGFEALITHVSNWLPCREVFTGALRRTERAYPEEAVRELIANALVHQDFSVTGAGPMVEIFTSRIEITNPGKPLVPTNRFIDSAPTSRNETLASLMRRFRICEERGSGIDKVIRHIELSQLPAPLFAAPPNATRVTLFSRKELSRMDKAERIRACYWHACLCYMIDQPMTNATLRERFGVASKNGAVISRLLKEALKDGVIVVRDPEAGFRSRSYLPFWAAPDEALQSFV